MIFRSIYVVASVFLLIASPIHAQELQEHVAGIWSARVVSVQDERSEQLPGTEVSITVQDLRVKLLEGPRAGEVIALINDYVVLEAGDRLFVSYLVGTDGREIFDIQEPDRTRGMIFLLGVFVIVVVLFGGWEGIRSLAGLAATLGILVFLLFPHLARGEAVIWWASLYAFIASTVALLITHGINKKTAAALFGIAGAILITVLLAAWGVEFLNLTGFYADESLYLNFDTQGKINFAHLLLAAIIIGTLGVLDDITSTQASTVTELASANPSLSSRTLYKKAMVVGRAHVSALVNTLALAYAGTALPFLLLMYISPSSPLLLLNKELFATEVLRVVASSIGLIFAVPFSTLAAVFLAKQR
ncbi:MAG: YibE/F family protein [Patescibacteria group bacterium]